MGQEVNPWVWVWINGIHDQYPWMPHWVCPTGSVGQAGTKHEHLNLKAYPTGKWSQSGSGLPAELSGKGESLQLHYIEVVPDPWQ